MNRIKPIFYPLGPQELGGETWYAILLCGETGGAEAIWGQSWEDAIAEAERVSGLTEWTTLPWLASKVSKAEGRGRLIPADSVGPLAWALANHADPQGVTRAIHEETALPMMQAMGRVSVMESFMTDGQSQPFQLHLITGEAEKRYYGAYDLSGGVITVMLTMSEDHLRSIYETHFGVELPDEVQFMMAQIIDDHDGAVGRATGALFGGGFKPRLRSRMGGGVAGATSDDEARLLTLALTRIPALIRGSTLESGDISLLGTVHQVEMLPIDLG